MKEKIIDNHIVVYDSYNLENNPYLQEFLKSKKIKKNLENIKEDVIMDLGWDWTILRAIRKYYKQQKTFLPINFGTKWFLLNDKNFIKKTSEFVTREYPLLDLKVKTEDKIFKDIAFNEVVLKDIDWKMLDINIKVNKANSFDLQADWLLVSTPAGSTGYNSSLHWPILPHSSNSFIMTYMAAWKPKLQTPAILENSSVIKIKNQNRIHWVIVSADWNELLKTNSWEKIKLIVKKLNFTVKLLIEKSYEEKWNNKVLEEQGFNN